MNTPVNDIATFLVPFSASQTPTTFSNKYETFNPITSFSDFTIAFASPEKDTDNYLKKSNTVNANSYIDLAYEKSQIVRFINGVLQRLQGDIRRFFFKSRCKDLFVKLNATLNSEIKHLQKELKSKDDIINHTLTLFCNITYTENKNNSEKDDIESSKNDIKDHIKNAKIDYSLKKNKSNDENRRLNSK